MTQTTTIRSNSLGRCVLAVIVGLGVALLAPAQTDDPNAEIVARVNFTREQFTQLTDQMLEVAKLLEAAEPETAQVLRQAVREARRAFIAEDMDKVASQLRQGLVSAAAAGQSDVIVELQKLLELLQSGSLDMDERAERLKDWRQRLAQLDKLLAKQRQLENQSRLTAEAKELDRRLAELTEQLKSIISRQEALLGQTQQQSRDKSNDALRELGSLREAVRQLIRQQDKLSASTGQVGVDKLPLVGRAQGELAERTGALADKLKGAAAKSSPLAKGLAKLGADADRLEDARQAVARAAEAMISAASALDVPNAAEAAKRQEDAAADLRAAEQALAEALQQAGDDSPSGKLGAQQGELAGETADLAKGVGDLADQTGQQADTQSLKAAAGEMRSAADKLEGQQPAQAAKHQADALRLLKDDAYELAQLRQRIKDKAARPLKDQASEQSDLADRTDQAATDMAGDETTQPTPGQTDVEQAGADMQQASGKLGDQSGGQSGSQRASDANADQRQAAEKLQKARDALAEAIAREEDMLEAQQLAAIDQMLKTILEGQKNISAATKDVRGQRGADGYERLQQLRLTELSRGEGRLADDVGKVGEILQEEGKTAVFPAVLAEVAKQLTLLQTRLADRQADLVTQGIQEDVELALAEMIASIREELAKRRKQDGEGGEGGGKGGGGGSDGPLVPPVAELKMLWRLQKQIASRTTELDAGAGEMTPEQLAARCQHLAERQERLQTMTLSLDAKLRPPSADDEEPQP